jgi:hypothetical protein
MRERLAAVDERPHTLDEIEAWVEQGGREADP